MLGPFLNTIYFSIGSALLATLIGGMVAWVVTRTDTPLRGLGYFTAFASFGTPFILYTIGWILLLGKAGPVNHWLKILFNQNTPVINVYSMAGMIFIEALLWSPFVFLMLAASFRSMDPSLEEASAACGARVWQTLRRISLRLMLPAFFSVPPATLFARSNRLKFQLWSDFPVIFVCSQLRSIRMRNDCRRSTVMPVLSPFCSWWWSRRLCMFIFELPGTVIDSTR